MKTKQIFGVLLTLGGVLTAAAKDYNVAVLNNLTAAQKSFSLIVETTEIHSSMCGMTVTEIQSVKPLVPMGFEIAPVGVLSVTMETAPDQMCLMAFGPHRGAVTLDIGADLPKLNGLYNLVINGEDQGILTVTDEGANIATVQDNI